MNDAKFWKLLEAARHGKSLQESIADLEEKLQAEQSENITRFLNIYRRKMNALLLPQLANCCYLLTGELTEDRFEDFRAWLILQGKLVCSLAIEKPDHLLELLPESDLLKPYVGEMHFLAHRAFAAQLDVHPDSEEYLDCLLAFEDHSSIKPLTEADEELFEPMESNSLAKAYPALYQFYMLNVDLPAAPSFNFERQKEDTPSIELEAFQKIELAEPASL